MPKEITENPHAEMLVKAESMSANIIKLVNSIRQNAYIIDSEIASRRFDNALMYIEQIEKEAALLKQTSAELAKELQKNEI